ncbi:unnamed protein product [Lactuca virosa]|uniref:SWIM-type domain-containing protein n=1 Tax=Lactuca virosa TaxID=75947 RepID=A0AAU9NVG4_9ASTR|nr:unnamed protein product [Lactuca virosa]
MHDIHDFDTIDVELDAYFKKKQASRCKDEFLNILCEEDDYEAVDDAQTENHAQTENDAQTRNDSQTGITKEESDEDYLERSNEEDSDEEFEYSTHNPNVKWNKMRPTLGERSWYAVPSGVNEYEVRNGFQNYGVNLKEKMCACRLWELSGIPCVHAQVAILYTNQDPLNFISSWFSKNNYKATYDQNIHPVNGKLQQIEGLGLSEAELQQIEGLGLSEAEVQQIEDADVAMSQDIGIGSQITVEDLPTTQALGDEEMMNEEDGIDEAGMDICTIFLEAASITFSLLLLQLLQTLLSLFLLFLLLPLSFKSACGYNLLCKQKQFND